MRFFIHIVVALMFIAGVSSSLPAYAQSKPFSLGVANYITVVDKGVEDGMIAASSAKGFILANKPYDRFMIGVITLNPAVVFDLAQKSPNTFPLITNGQAYVLVSGQNGAIKKGDLITSSTKKGVGARAVKSGYVLGYALEDFTPKKADDQKKIGLTIKIYPHTVSESVSSSLLDVFNFTSTAASEEPIRVFKYILAALVLLLSILLGFMSFGRIASRGVEALGRNPMAARMIQFGIALNVFLSIVIVGAGLIVALFIIRL